MAEFSGRCIMGSEITFSVSTNGFSWQNVYTQTKDENLTDKMICKSLKSPTKTLYFKCSIYTVNLDWAMLTKLKIATS